MDRAVAFVVLLGVLKMTVAIGASDPMISNIQQRCGRLDDPIVQTLMTTLGEFENNLPHIPPDEMRYFEAESQSIFKIDDGSSIDAQSIAEKRFSELTSRRLYYFWKARGDLEQATAAVGLILTKPANGYSPESPYVNEEANKLQHAADALPSLSSLQQSLGEAIAKDGANGATPLLTKQQTAAITDRRVRLVIWISLFIDCKLAKLAPAKSF
jgi:hypothetical protein